MQKLKNGKTHPYIPFLFLLLKDAGGMGDESPHRCVFGDLSLKRGRRLEVKKRKKQICIFFNAHAVKLATLT